MNNKEGIRTENGLIPDSPADAFVLVISLLFFFVFSHPVTYSDFREDVFRLRRIRFKLPADICHIYAEDLIVAVRVGPPYIGEDGRICNDFAGVLGQAGDDLVLDGSQVDLLPVDRQKAL